MMAMFDDSSRTRIDETSRQRERWSAKGRQVRLVLLTWPVVALLGATVTAAACLLADCKRGGQIAAKDTLIGQSGTVKSLSFRPDGAILASVGVDGSIVIWDLATTPERSLLPDVSGPVRCAVFSPNNRFLATGSPSATVALHNFDVALRRRLDDARSATVGARAVAFAPDGATVAVGQQDGAITLWDPATEHKLATLDGHREFVAALAFSPDGTTLASSAGDHSVRIWDLPSRRQRSLLSGQTTNFAELKFSPDGNMLVLGDDVSPVVRLWDIEAGALRASLRGPSGAVVALAISPNGETLAAADYKGQITFWDFTTLRTRPTRLRHPGVLALAFAPDGRSLATGGFDGTIHLWDFPISAPQE
jgi:WD40 repeat protein